MNQKYIEQAVIEFSKTGINRTEKSFTFKNEGYTVTIEKNSQVIVESRKAFNNVNSISALPSGNTCGCCNGTGRS